MLGILKRFERKKLEATRQRLLEECRNLALIDRKASDQKAVLAYHVLQQIEKLRN